MTNGPLVSIIINNFNYDQFLPRAVASAQNQTYRNIEVVVVDDGSTDSSTRVIHELVPSVIPVLKPNGGQASAFNAGFSASRGDIIIFLDADDELLPHAAAETVEAFADPKTVKVHWPLWEVDAEGSRSGVIKPEAMLQEGDLFRSIVRGGPRTHTNPPTSGNAFRRTLLDSLLPMPEDDYRICADFYLVSLAPLYGDVRRLTRPAACWRRHDSNNYNSDAKTLYERVTEEVLLFDAVADGLAKACRGLGVTVDPMIWKKRNFAYRRLSRMGESMEILLELVPEGESLALADDGDWTGGIWSGAPVLPRRTTVPFIEPAAELLGHPDDHVTLLEQTERLRSAGVRYLAFAFPGNWWLDHYPDLATYLGQPLRATRIRRDLAVFDLASLAPDRSSSRPKGRASLEDARRDLALVRQRSEAVAAQLAELENELSLRHDSQLVAAIIEASVPPHVSVGIVGGMVRLDALAGRDGVSIQGSTGAVPVSYVLVPRGAPLHDELLSERWVQVSSAPDVCSLYRRVDAEVIA